MIQECCELCEKVNTNHSKIMSNIAQSCLQEENERLKLTILCSAWNLNSMKIRQHFVETRFQNISHNLNDRNRKILKFQHKNATFNSKISKMKRKFKALKHREIKKDNTDLEKTFLKEEEIKDTNLPKNWLQKWF